MAVETAVGRFEASRPDEVRAGDKVVVAVRPEAVRGRERRAQGQRA